MRAIVTGASGFLGVNLVNTLLDLGWDVLAVVRPNSKNMSRLSKNENLRIIELDISDISALSGIVSERFDAFFHFAWSGIRGKDRNDLVLQESNFINSQNAVQTAFDLGCTVYVSSGSQAECGITNEVITEQTPMNPVCEYGKAKVRSLNYVADFCCSHGMKFIWARIFSLYGIMDYENSLINYALNQMLEDKQVKLSPCTQLWDFLNVCDACYAIVLAIQSNLNGVVNIASGSPRVLKEFILEMKSITNSHSELLFGAIPTPESGLVSLCPDVSLLKLHTNFVPKIDFKSGICKLIAFKLKGKI